MCSVSLEKEQWQLCWWHRGAAEPEEAERTGEGRQEGVPARLVAPLGELDLETKVLVIFSWCLLQEF